MGYGATPKGLNKSAQGQRSATLGDSAHCTLSTLKGLHKTERVSDSGPVEQAFLCNPFRVCFSTHAVTQGGAPLTLG